MLAAQKLRNAKAAIGIPPERTESSNRVISLNVRMCRAKSKEFFNRSRTIALLVHLDKNLVKCHRTTEVQEDNRNRVPSFAADWEVLCYDTIVDRIVVAILNHLRKRAIIVNYNLVLRWSLDQKIDNLLGKSFISSNPHPEIAVRTAFAKHHFCFMN